MGSASVALVDNRTARHKEAICGPLERADTILIGTAFLKSSGFDQIHDALKQAKKRGAKITLIAGTDFYLTDPKALHDAYDLIGQRLLVCSPNKETFHPKIFYWEKGDLATLIVGSANLTHGGLVSNFELSVAHTMPRSSAIAVDAKEYFKRLETDGRVRSAKRSVLDRYEQEHEIYRQRVAKAEKAARKKIRKTPDKFWERKEAILGRYLHAYRDEEEEADNWNTRERNYVEAREVLSELADASLNSASGFLKIYDRLVGARKRPGLWHSGSLYRQKTDISPHYRRFQKLLRTILQDIDDEPEALLTEVVRQALPIEGLGLNVITEILNTLRPDTYPVLNANSLTGLQLLGLTIPIPKDKTHFSFERYQRFTDFAQELAQECDFEDLSRVDHFLNYVYWQKKKTKPYGRR